MTPPPPGKKRRWLRGLAWFFGIILLLATIVYFTQDFWRAIYRNYVVAHYGAKLPEVDEIEILAINNAGDEGDPYAFNANGQYYNTVKIHTANGAEAAELANLWRQIPVGRQYEDLCFNPAYLLRFRNHGKLIFETAVCWHCNTYTLSVPLIGQSTNGFDSTSKPAQDLLAKLTLYNPLPAPPKRPPPSATPEPSP